MERRSWILLLALLSLAGTVLAEDPLLIVAPGFKPISFEADGEPAGLGTALVVEAFSRMGIPIRIQVLPGSRAIAMVQAGTADALFAVAKTPEREAFAIFPSEPIIDQPISLFARKGARIAYGGDIKGLAPYRIGIIRGGRFSPQFEEAMRDRLFPDVEEVTEYEQTVRMLDIGRIDIVIGARISVLYAAKELGKAEALQELQPPIAASSPAFLAFAKAGKAVSLIPEFEKAMKGMIRDGSYARIMQSFLK